MKVHLSVLVGGGWKKHIPRGQWIAKILPDRPRIISVWILILAGMLIGSGCAQSTSVKSVVAPGLGAQMDAIIEQRAAEGFSGVVLVVQGGEVVLHKGYGLADRQRSIPIVTDTVFDIGSVSKQFTKASILKLEDQGKLKLSDSIDKFLDNVPDDKTKITLDHLIHHTSGLQEYVDNQADLQRTGVEFGDFVPMSSEEAIERILGQPLLFKPGEGEAYSNSGYTLLAAIVELVSGQPFQDYVRENLLTPAGLKKTGFYNDVTLWKAEQVAQGYGASQFGEPNSPYYWPEVSWVLMGNGGMVSSPGELYAWIVALKSHKVLSASALEKYYPPGVEVYNYAGGNEFGFITEVLEVPNKEAVIIVASNADGGINSSTRDIVRTLAQSSFGMEFPVRVNPDATRVTSGTKGQGEADLLTKWGLGESPVERQAAHFLETLSQEDEASIRELIQNNFAPSFRDGFPLEEHIRQITSMREQLGEFGLIEARRMDEFSAELVLSSNQSNHKYEALIMVERQSPHLIAGLLFEEFE